MEHLHIHETGGGASGTD